MKPYYEHAGISIYVGDCREILPQLEEVFDACVTDPPYHLTTGKKGGSGPASVNLDSPYGRARIGTGFMGKAWDGGDVAFRAETWAAVMNALKPGAHLMAFGGTRTFHRLACAIEDAGFEIRDTLMWLYGSGFPKSLDISKAIDKAAGAERGIVGRRTDRAATPRVDIRGGRLVGAACGGGKAPIDLSAITAPATDAARLWDGYGTALKPAWEPIILGMKPLDGTFVENALKHGIGGLNIDGSRIDAPDGVPKFDNLAGDHKTAYSDGLYGSRRTGELDTATGRWPANVLLDEEAAAIFPDAPGQLADASTNTDSRRNQNCYGTLKRGSQEASAERRYADNGATNFAALPGARRLDTGSAARFFYTAKADSTERGTGNNHPTVKPLDLMRYLCKLLCPPSGGLFLEPFAGSGTTLVACKALNIRAIGIELSEEYAEIAASRLAQEILPFAEGAESNIGHGE